MLPTRLVSTKRRVARLDKLSELQLRQTGDDGALKEAN